MQESVLIPITFKIEKKNIAYYVKILTVSEKRLEIILQSLPKTKKKNVKKCDKIIGRF